MYPMFFSWLRRRRATWEYGTCKDRPARRHRQSGEVQFVLWQAGEQGHEVDYWYRFDSSWGDGFDSSWWDGVDSSWWDGFVPDHITTKATAP